MLNVFKFKHTLAYVALFLTLALVSFGLQTATAAHENVDGGYEYKTALTGAAEIPAVVTDTKGDFKMTVNEEKNEAAFKLQVQDGKAITAAHLHCGDVNETGPVFAHLFGNIPGGFNVDGTLASFTLTNANIQNSGSSSCDTAITNIATMMSAIDAGNVYVNVHNTAYPNGVIRGQVKANVGGGVGTSTATSTPVSADKDKDGFISVVEGIPFYGPIVESLTKTGDTSPSSALALDRFPVAKSNGSYTYNRTFTLSSTTDLDNAHIIVHGADIDDSGKYDGTKPSSVDPLIPFEAAVPV